MDIRRVYRFRPLVKQNKKAKIYAVFCFAGKRFFFYICDVITSPEKEKSSANHYSHPHPHVPGLLHAPKLVEARPEAANGAGGEGEVPIYIIYIYTYIYIYIYIYI